MRFTTTDFANNFSLTGTATAAGRSRLTSTYPGLYNLQFSVQLYNNANENIDYIIWFRKNGTDIPDSATNVAVYKAAGQSGRMVAAWNYMYEQTTTTDWIEIMWMASTVNGQLLYESGSLGHPAIPSVIATITQIA
jgi:hypothetical protein